MSDLSSKRLAPEDAQVALNLAREELRKIVADAQKTVTSMREDLEAARLRTGMQSSGMTQFETGLIAIGSMVVGAAICAAGAGMYVFLKS